MKTRPLLTGAIALAAFLCASPYPVHADAVTDWNAVLATAQKASGLSANQQVRPGAIVNAAIFDAVNGIVRKYEPYFVDDRAPHGASPEAAAVQAAYTTLVALYPAPDQVARFNAQLDASLAALSGSSEAIVSGRAWGESVALDILNWRATDGVKNESTYFGGTQPGYWRTPMTGPSGVSVNLATMVPFALKEPTQFRPRAPYGPVDRLAALTTAAYAADFNEVKDYGGATSTERTAQQTDIARFCHAADNADERRALISIVSQNPRLLVDNARLFALCGLAAADSAIVCFDAKYAYGFWRPIDAIRLADADGNPATDPDPTWTPLATTPRHPEYLSAHVIFTAANFATAALLLGDKQTFTLDTPSFPSVTRTYPSFSAAIDEVVEARIWIGFHFRTACEDGRDLGYEIAHYVVKNFLRPRHRGNPHGDPER
jgi:hypothetical protein